ncbi:MAG: 30S ribosome-binding factor RbfA [Bacteriovoracaceae bacterium]|jgi:ribosome-binding factor A|nr:30S ribosome-binding factor RbfA [Bacteriovoracaceae bacterium]
MAREKYNKRAQYEDGLKEEGNLLLRQGFSDPRLQFISFTRVELSPDYSWSKFYWDTFKVEKRGDAKVALEGIRGKFRSLLSKVLNLRYTPSVTFIYDAQFESTHNIEQILNSEKEKTSK